VKIPSTGRAALILGALSAAAVVVVGTPVTGNLWGLVTGAGYAIPSESSIFTFRATVMNDGSGEWWMYGEDRRNFYGVPEKGAPPAGYLVFPRGRVGECPGFSARDVTTWCAPRQPPPAPSA
jgi:hypothetical protein